MGPIEIPKTQTVALVRNLGGTVEFKTDYPVPVPGRNEVLAKVLYTGVCQSGKSTSNSNISTHMNDHPQRQTSTQKPAQQPAQTATP